MRTLRRCCLLCLMFCYAGLGLAAEPLQLYTEEYPPLNFSQAGKPAGLGVEVVEEILRRTGQQASIEVVPWARGYQATLSQPNTGLFVAMRTEEREQLFKWVGPIIVGVTSFYALKGSSLTIAAWKTPARSAPSPCRASGTATRRLKPRACPTSTG